MEPNNNEKKRKAAGEALFQKVKKKSKDDIEVIDLCGYSSDEDEDCNKDSISHQRNETAAAAKKDSPPVVAAGRSFAITTLQATTVKPEPGMYRIQIKHWCLAAAAATKKLPPIPLEKKKMSEDCDKESVEPSMEELRTDFEALNCNDSNENKDDVSEDDMLLEDEVTEISNKEEEHPASDQGLEVEAEVVSEVVVR
jgi:hypothetical protein